MTYYMLLIIAAMVLLVSIFVLGLCRSASREMPAPPNKHVNYACATQGHKYLKWEDGPSMCVRCGDDPGPVEETTELGHQGQTGRAA